KRVSAACGELNVEAHGKSTQEALDNLSQAIQTHMADCAAKGTLEKVLTDLSQAEISRYAAGEGVADTQEYVEVLLPIRFKARRAG
ncbi:MAG: DUF4507 domain-containing protein, partial [Deltaproteobacteria bacterium]|nr:DUF4507 domain-containing protein [Deltaproteobacteria bacterium]